MESVLLASRGNCLIVLKLKSLCEYSNVLRISGEFEKSYRALLKYLNFRDSIEKLRTNQYPTAYLLHRKLDAYRQEAKMQSLVAENERIPVQFLILLVVIAVPLLILITFKFIARTKSARLLAQNNHLVGELNHELNALMSNFCGTDYEIIIPIPEQ